MSDWPPNVEFVCFELKEATIHSTEDVELLWDEIERAAAHIGKTVIITLGGNNET